MQLDLESARVRGERWCVFALVPEGVSEADARRMEGFGWGALKSSSTSVSWLDEEQ